MGKPYSYQSDRTVPAFSDNKPVILFDGHCGICSAWAEFLLKYDRAGRYRLLAAQTPLGQALYRHYGLDPDEFETNLLIADGVAWVKSEGTIRMAEGLGFPWSMAVILRLLPPGVRDWLYDLIARNRFRFMGRRDACYLPDEANKDRFLA